MTNHKTPSRFLSMFMSLILVIGMLPTTVFAENSWGGTGVAEVQEDPSSSTEPGLCAMGNNLVLRNGSNGGMTQVYYADASGSIVGAPIDLGTTGLALSGDTTGGFDLRDIRLLGTYNGTFNGDQNAFANLDVVLRMEGGTLADISAGNINAQCKSFTVHMSGGTLTSVVTAFNSAIAAHTIYISGGRIEKNQAAQHPLYLSGSPSIGGEGCGITVKAGEKFYLNGELSGASVYVVPKADFADGTVIAEGSGYQITEDDISQLHLTGDYAADKELYLENNAVKIRARQVITYNVWVGSTQVTEENATDVLGNNTVSYNAATNTLTLNGLSLSDQGHEVTVQDDTVFASIFSQDDLNIVLAKGSTNTISTTGSIGNAQVLGAAAMAEDGSAGMVSVSGSGSLSVTQTLSPSTAYAVGIFGGEVDVTDAGLNFRTFGSGYTMGIGADKLDILNADITCSGMAFGLTGTSSLSVSGDSHIKATGSMGALYCAEGTVSVDTGLTILGSPQENDFENLSVAQVSSYGNNIVVGTETAKTVEITGIPVVSYLDESGAKQTLTGAYTTVTSGTATWNSGWYVVDGDVTIDSRVTVTGDVKLIIKDGANLTVNGGILVPSGSTFTVYGQQNATGNLTSIGTNGNAGIGGDDVNVNFGTIILAAKGKITANGDSNRAAGIGGGGQMNNGKAVDGTIHIYQGVINATGGTYAAGIGGGADSITDCTIIIDGGTVTAQGGLNNVGIGGTDGSKTITINGGNIKAYGSGAGAGIGGSYNASGGSITVTGGVIEADSIGGGSAAGGGSGGTIVISGGVVTADRIGAGGSNREGLFSTTPTGNAVIFAGSIIDQSDKENWSGLIFENGEGKIYGSGYNVEEDITIPENVTLIIENGKTLTVENGVTINNNGAIKVNDGGTYSGAQPANKVVYQIQWDTDGDGRMDGTTYVAYGEMPFHEDGSKKADAQYTYTFTGWSPEFAEVTEPAQYTAEFDSLLNQYTVTLPSGEGYTITTDQSTTVDYGTDFIFTVNIQDGYSKTDEFAVKANGTGLTAQTDGSYKVTVQDDTTITVEGVADVTAPSGITVSYGKDSFKEFLNTITFGLFFKDTVTVTITATDEGSGVKEFTYQLGDGALQTVAAENGKITFTVEPEFKGNIKNVTATDNAGNTSEGIDYEYFAVEKNKPMDVTVDTNGYESGKWINGDVTITVSGSTALSGIAKYQYSTDDGKNWHDITATEKTDATETDPLNVTKAQITVSDSGSKEYIFRAVSGAGNESVSSESVTVKIDKVQPNITLTGDTDSYRIGDTIEITANAGESGVTNVEMQKDGGNWTDITATYEGGYEVTENGTYTFRMTNGAGTTATDSITYNKIDNTNPVLSVNTNGYESGRWTNQEVTLKVSNTASNLGTTTIRYKVDGGDWQDYTDVITVSEETEGTRYTFKAMSASGVESDEVSVTVKLDKTVPDGDIEIEQNSVKKFINSITFGLFFNKNVDVTITGTDNLSGVAAVEYYRSAEILTEDAVKAISEWTAYASISETAEDAEKFIYYVKVTDYAGNVAYFGSEGITFDLTAPVVAGIMDGTTYYTSQSVTVADTNLESVTLNDDNVGETFTLAGNQEAVYTIAATDKAGNVTTYNVTMKPIASLAETIEDITSANVNSANKEDIEAVKAAVAAVDSKDASSAEKEALQEILDKCDSLTDQIEETAEKISSLKEDIAGYSDNTVTSSDKDAITQLQQDILDFIFSDNLTEEEKAEMQTQADKCESLRDKIEQTAQAVADLEEALKDYDPSIVTSGDKKTIEQFKEDLQSLINSGNLTEEEKAEMEELVNSCDTMLEEITAAGNAGTTENTHKVEDITSDNVNPKDKENLISAKEDLENALESFGGNYTESEKKDLQDKLEQINGALESLEKTENVQEAITALPDTVAPGDAGTEHLIHAAKEQYDALTVHEKSLISEELKEKLEHLLGALLDYRIIAGNDSKWTVGADNAITMTANGPIEKFVGIKVDGKTVDAVYYTVKSGSAIITLKPSYLNALSVGKHTLTVIYTDGETSGEFEIIKNCETTTPGTGDSSNIMLWAALLFVSGGMLSAMMYRKKKQAK